MGDLAVGLVAVDDTTIEYVKGRPFSPRGVEWDQAVAYWRTLHSDPGAHFDRVVELDAFADDGPQSLASLATELDPARGTAIRICSSASI